MRKTSIYALYHGDKFIDIGSKEYLARKINVDVKTIIYYITPSWKKKSNYNSWIVIKIGESYIWKDKSI